MTDTERMDALDTLADEGDYTVSADEDGFHICCLVIHHGQPVQREVNGETLRDAVDALVTSVDEP